MAMPDWERPQDDAEARLRARMERVEREHQVRRKRAAVIGAITLAFVSSLAFALIAHAVRGKPAGSEPQAVASRPARAEPAPQTTPPPAPAAETPEPSATPVPAPEEAPPPKAKPRPATPRPAPERRAERVRIDIGTQGYEPSVVRVAAGTRVTLTVGKGEGCAAGFLMPELGVDKDNSSGPITFTIGPLKPGTYRFTCGMQMVEGRIIVG